MREIKVDSRRNAPFVIASGACTARQSINKKRILGKRILLAQNLWIATPCRARLAMTEKENKCLVRKSIAPAFI